jgi:hypothetical protein
MLAKSLHSANMQATEVCQHSSFGKHDSLEYHALPPLLKPILHHMPKERKGRFFSLFMVYSMMPSAVHTIASRSRLINEK